MALAGEPPDVGAVAKEPEGWLAVRLAAEPISGSRSLAVKKALYDCGGMLSSVARELFARKPLKAHVGLNLV